MKKTIKMFSLLLCVLLLLPLSSCAFAGYTRAEIILQCENPFIPTEGEVWLTVRISDEDAKEYGAAFSEKIERKDLLFRSELEGKEIRIEYKDAQTVVLHCKGVLNKELTEDLNNENLIDFCPSAFAKKNITGHLFCGLCRPYLAMTDFSGGSKDGFYTLHFTLETRYTKVKGISAGDFELQNVGNPGEEFIDVMPGEDGKTISFTLSGVKKEDESKPFVLVLKEAVFTIGKPITIEIPAIGEIVLLKQFMF